MLGSFIVHFQVYVKINKDASTDGSIFEAGKSYFNCMEQGLLLLYGEYLVFIQYLFPMKNKGCSLSGPLMSKTKSSDNFISP